MIINALNQDGNVEDDIRDEVQEISSKAKNE